MWLNHHPTQWVSQLPKVQSRDKHCSRRGKLYIRSQQSTLDMFKDFLKHFSLHALKMLLIPKWSVDKELQGHYDHRFPVSLIEKSVIRQPKIPSPWIDWKLYLDANINFYSP